MQPSSYVPSFYFYKLADAISAPYTSLDAYRAGAIDSNGNLLKPVSSIDAFEFLVIKLKQIFDQLPYGTTKAKLSNYLATLNLFSEEVESYEITQEQFHCLVEGIVCHNTNNEVSYLELLEDMGTGGGAGALGVPAQGGNINQGGVSGYDIKMKLPLLKRKKGDYFDDCEIFDVCPEEFSSFMNSKQWKDVPDSETKNYLRRFQRRNKNGKVGVRGLNPVSGEQDLFWITYPAKNFMEEVDLSNINFLFEEKKTNKEREHLVYNALGELLDKKGFQKNTKAKKREDLAVGEYAVFHPSREKIDVVVHHNLSGKPGFTHTEAKYQRNVAGRSSTTYDVVIPRNEIDIDSDSGKTHKINPTKIIQRFGTVGKKSQARKYLRQGSELVKKTISSILKAKSGMMLVGNNKNIHITHNSKDEDTRNHDDALLKHIGLVSTHTADDLSKSGNPYLGNIGSEERGEHVKIRVSAPRHVIRNGQKIDTIESQQKNAETLGIKALEDINPE